MPLQNPETEKFYQDLFSLTSRPEWATFNEYFKELLKAKIDTAIDTETMEDLHRTKGQVEVLRSIVSFRDVLDSHYQFMIAEEEQFDEDI